MASIFTKIVLGEIPSYKIHTLVIPKKEVDYLFDLDDETLKGLTAFSKRVAKAIDKTIECKRVGVVVLGLEVPHAHIHLIPLQSEADACFSKPKLKLAVGEFKEIAEKISSAFE